MAARQRQRRGIELRDTQGLDGNGCSHDIHQGIDRAHFVKMHLCDARTMHGRLGFRQALEDGARGLSYARGERRGIQQRDDIREVACRLCEFFYEHLKARTAHTPVMKGFKRQLIPCYGQPSQRYSERVQ